MSGLFRFELDLLGESGVTASSSDVIGKKIDFSVEKADKSRAHYHGVISEFSVAGTDRKGHTLFRATVVPWLWLLTQKSDCRIFQNMSVPQIVEQIFGDLGHSDFDLRLDQSYQPMEYCVQYRETNFNFVSRLLEREGIFYFFERAEGSHKLVLADSTSAYLDCEEAEVSFPESAGSNAVEDHITGWERRFVFHSGGTAHTDYNFKTPTQSLEAVTKSLHTGKAEGSDGYELYDYPGEHETRDEGSGRIGVRMEEVETFQDVVHASSLCRTFRPGRTFKVKDHHTSTEAGQAFLITSISHSISEPMAYETGAGTDGHYSNSFTCIPSGVIFRPPRVTPEPQVAGVQTAVVVGPKGEEIHTDEYGRVKVQFFWDREGKEDENSSCWVRVSHSVAGRKWGFMAIPRIGQEVVIDFLEGDPDRPLIVGSVYNADQMPHYALPDEKTRSYIKTNSTKGGDGYNELMFEDLKDEERVFMHAQKDMDTRVLNDSKERIFGNRHQIIGWEKDGDKGGDQREVVYEDKHLKIKRNQVEHIEGNFQLMVGNGEADDGGQVDIISEKNWNEKVEGDLSSTVKGESKTKVSGGLSQTVGGNYQNKVGGDFAVESGAGKDIHLKAGMNVTIEAGPGQLTLKGLGGFITIGPDGVTIQGIMVKINSGGSAGSGKGCSPASPEEPQKAQPAEPALAWNSTTGMKSTS